MSDGLVWFKSSHSDTEGSNCVEVAPTPHAVHVRDSKDPQGPALTFTPAAWVAFVGAVATGRGGSPGIDPPRPA
ncbi:DUF397 domain-containing protein [Streptomyces sp. MI02-7b]|uniref:DUF397 domain-containing protein n=1 Tax=Streptomyces sp. MI02-7b TaxID=462941 RepID=UPI0029B76090|nr:DUF397 domain-containing protein [Streptomyces sp. MI02-7b]MDX3074715.1 DUF397 domain-containing protein [Streptomyces sp. MI02-7b]